MAPSFRPQGLLDRLPAVRGRLIADAPLGKLTWFRVGGPAEVLFRPADADDLAAFLAARPADVPVTVLGTGSNLLVRDGGVPGVVVRLGRPFATVRIDGQTVIAGAGTAGLAVANAAQRAGLGGLEFLGGIPGTVGGAVRMNAGAYGRELSAVALEVEMLDSTGARTWHGTEELGFSYRHASFPESWIVLGARLSGTPGDSAEIARALKTIQAERQLSQPVRSATGGSTFVNPPGEKAWQLIDRAGCRGLRRGDAQVSEKHCNFLINCGRATAADLEGLGEEVRRRVFAATGIRLEWEIRRLGISAGGLGVAANPSHENEGGQA